MAEVERRDGAEVEVTDAMTKAAVSAYCEHDLRFERLDDVLRHVFEAMLAARDTPQVKEMAVLDLGRQ